MNEEFAKTDAGKIQQAKNAIGDMGEEIGAVLLPAVADLVSWFQTNLMPVLQQVIDFFKQHPQLATFALAIAGITAVLGPFLIIMGSVVTMMGTVATAATAMDIALAPIIGIVALIVAIIAALVAIGIILYKNWDTIKAKAIEVWNGIKKSIMNAVNVIKTRVMTNFNTLKTTVLNVWNAIKTRVSSIVNGIKTTVSNVFNSIKTTASTVWNGIKTAITKPINAAKNTVKNIVDKLKGFFPLSVGKIFSNLKVPHINIKGGKAPFGIGGKGSKPSISVSWNKKAMENPYLFSNATLFGAGEAGDEVLYGRKALMRDIAEAVGGGGQITVNVYGSDGMSVTELADAVERKLIQTQKRRTQAWA